MVARPDFAKSFRSATIVFPGHSDTHTHWVEIKGDRVTIHEDAVVPTEALDNLVDEQQFIRDYAQETVHRLGLTVKPEEVRVRPHSWNSYKHAVVTKQVQSGADLVAGVVDHTRPEEGVLIILNCGKWPKHQRFEWHR